MIYIFKFEIKIIIYTIFIFAFYNLWQRNSCEKIKILEITFYSLKRVTNRNLLDSPLQYHKRGKIVEKNSHHPTDPMIWGKLFIIVNLRTD